MSNVEFVFITRQDIDNKQYYTWDNLSKLDFNQLDSVIHLAGLAHDTKGVLDDTAYFNVNYELTQKIYDKFLKSTAKKFIYVSSVKAAADKVDGLLIETDTPNPITAYGKSKYKAEQYILQNSTEARGKSSYILRPCMVHGPGNKGNLNLLYQFVKKGIPYPLAAYQNSRSFLSIENLCFVCKEILLKDVEQGIYNLADDTPLSTEELYKLIANTINKDARVLNVPKGLISTIARLGDILKLPINTDRVEKLTESYVVSNQKIKTELGLFCMPVSTINGLELTISSFDNTANDS